MKEHHTKVLECLAESYSSDGMGFCGFQSIMSRTRLDRSTVRRSCRYLARKGLAEFSNGLWDDEGMPRGSGYAATRTGRDLALEETRT